MKIGKQQVGTLAESFAVADLGKTQIGKLFHAYILIFDSHSISQQNMLLESSSSSHICVTRILLLYYYVRI